MAVVKENALKSLWIPAVMVVEIRTMHEFNNKGSHLTTAVLATASAQAQLSEASWWQVDPTGPFSPKGAVIYFNRYPYLCQAGVYLICL